MLQQVEVLLRCNEEILEILIQSGDSDPEFYGYEWPTVCGRVGRPALYVAEKLIRFLRDLRFTWKKIAELLGISESTLRRRRAGLDLEGFTSIIGKKHPVASSTAFTLQVHDLSCHLKHTCNVTFHKNICIYSHDFFFEGEGDGGRMSAIAGSESTQDFDPCTAPLKRYQITNSSCQLSATGCFLPIIEVNPSKSKPALLRLKVLSLIPSSSAIFFHVKRRSRRNRISFSAT